MNSFPSVPTLLRLGRALAVALVFTICTGCGDYYRPVAFPVTPTLPDPSSLHFSMVLAENVDSNGIQNPGSNSRIDVSGDTNVGVAKLGLGPVHAALLPNGSRVYVANGAENSVSTYSPSDATTVATISLSVGLSPVFVHTTQNDTVYVASLETNPPTNIGKVSVISTGNNVVTSTIDVGHIPFAMAETPNGQKLYVVNRADGTVTSINTVDKNVNATITTGTTPIWAVARSDNARIYVLNQDSGTISVIDTCVNTPGCPPTSDRTLNRFSVEAGSNFMFYDKTLQRLYVTEPASAKLAVLDVSGDPSADMQPPLAEIDLSAECPSGCTLAGVTALPDGTRVYVSSYQIQSTCSQPGDTPPCITSRVTIIKTPNNSILKPSFDSGKEHDVPVVPACDSVRFRRFIAAAADNSRVFVSNCDSGSTGIIRTSDDTHVLDLMAPVSATRPSDPTATPPPQNPVFLLAGR